MLRTAGLAGEVSGNVAISIPGVSVQGHFSLAINNTTAPVDETITFGPEPGATRALVVGDVNGDNKPDLIVGVSGGKNVLYINDGTANPFASLPGLVIGDEDDDTTSLALADVDGDGDRDLIVGNDGTRRRTALYLNDGAGVFTLATASLGSGANAVAVGDLNGDGFADIVFGGNGASGERDLPERRPRRDDAGVERLHGVHDRHVPGRDDRHARARARRPRRRRQARPRRRQSRRQDARLPEPRRRVERLAGLRRGRRRSARTRTTRRRSQSATSTATASRDIVVGNDLAVQPRLPQRRTAGDLAFSGGTDIAGTASLATTSLALVDVDMDGDLDLVVGVDGAANKLFLNGGTTAAKGASDGAVFASFTSASATFASGDVGHTITVDGTDYKIVAFVSAHELTLRRRGGGRDRTDLVDRQQQVRHGRRHGRLGDVPLRVGRISPRATSARS